MRLSTIKLAGFKSFVEPTKIPFPDPAAHQSRCALFASFVLISVWLEYRLYGDLSVYETGERVIAKQRPIVIITSNNTADETAKYTREHALPNKDTFD